MTGTVLVINSGSSSIKYRLINPTTGEAPAGGLVERIGESSGKIRHRYGTETTVRMAPITDHGEGLRRVLDLFTEVGPELMRAGIVAVGHRVVQGGKYFADPVIIDTKVMGLIEHLAPLAPLHNPPNLRGIEVGRALLADVPHVAVFDTAFFHALPAEAATYALNREVAERNNIRRYGAHGTSHQYVARTSAEALGRGQQDLKQIVLHLGNGASASAVDGGFAVETSMGLTPLEGLVMGTRTGDIDPAVIFHLRRNAGLGVDELDDLLNRHSGLEGLAGDNDMREVRALAEEGDAAARLALDVYNHRLKKYIGAYAAILGGLDVLTFTAGVGENDADMRAESLSGLQWLGIEVDQQLNHRNAGGKTEATIISSPESRVTVMVVPTNEELEIARQAYGLVVENSS